MTHRFHIEDLIHQDASGVVFRALDKETDLTVAVRRFFPFGAEGGGLHPEEQTAYDIAIGRLAGLSHPALRSVVCGGCDPVDGMPFIATEWIEGDPLHELVGQSPLPPEAAIVLITQALEVCELLSHVLAEEAIWVETELQTIIVSRPESGRGFTFWISPFRWLGGNEQTRGLESIVRLAEQALGWSGQLVSDQAGRGLGGWLKWLRASADTTTLKEARESLAALIGAEPPPPARKLVVQASRPPARPIKTSSSKTPLVIALILALITAGAGYWFMRRNSQPVDAPQTAQTAQATNPPPAKSPAPTPKKSTQASEASSRAEKLSAELANADKAQAETLAKQQAIADKQGGVISWNLNDLLVSKAGQPVVVGGQLRAIQYSNSKASLYLCFSRKPAKNEARGAITVKDAPPDLTEPELKPLIGKKIRLHGTIDLQKGLGLQRPDIIIKDRASIEVIE